MLADPTGDRPLRRHRVGLDADAPRPRASACSRVHRPGQDRVRVVAPHVGGAFGGKAGISPDHAVVVAAALRLGRPVAWTETRREAMLSMHGRGQVQYVELGLSREGRITGLRARVIGDCGAYAGFGGASPPGRPAPWRRAPYVVPRIRYDGVVRRHHDDAVGAFRGAGRPEAAAMLERILDMAADELGLAPEEIRRRNFVQPDEFPLDTFAGRDLRLRRLRPAARPRRCGSPTSRAARPSRRGAASAATRASSASASRRTSRSPAVRRQGARLRAGRTTTARATVRAGTSAHGQGHATAFSMIAADRLGIAIDRITYEQADTALVPRGGGTGGARSLQMGGQAVAQAAAELLRPGAGGSPPSCSRRPSTTWSWATTGSRCAACPTARVTLGARWPRPPTSGASRWRWRPTSSRSTRPSRSAPTSPSSRSTPRPGWSRRCATSRSTTPAGCVNPLLLAGQQHGGVAAGHQPGAVGAVRLRRRGHPVTSASSRRPGSPRRGCS